VWVSDWGANAILRFDPKTEKLESFPLGNPYASVRQLAGRKGEIWGAESGADKLFVLKAELGRPKRDFPYRGNTRSPLTRLGGDLINQ
jgi:streptogramin lyase